MNLRISRAFLFAAAAAAALLGAVTTAALAPVPVAVADEVEDLIKELKEAAKGDDDTKTCGVITKLETKPQQTVTDALADVARSTKSDTVFKSALKLAAQRKHEGLLKWMKGKIDDKKIIEDHPERHLAILDAISFYGDEAKICLKDLEKTVNKFLSTDSKISMRAIAAFGAVQSKPVVEQLIKWLEQTEQTAAGGSGGGKAPSAATKENYGQAKGAILKTLAKLTGQEMLDAASWTKWWKENEKTFTFPDPNDNLEPDWPTLKEYVDKSYLYTLKKPTVGQPPDNEGKFWTFEKNEKDGGRARLFYRDDKGYLWARCNIWLVKTWGEAGNLKQLMDYYEKAWREREFDKFSAEPEIKELRIGGRDFMVIVAKGAGKDNWKDWEGCERRVYATMVNPNLFLLFECVCRTGAEEPFKTGFWAAIEGVTFKK